MDAAAAVVVGDFLTTRSFPHLPMSPQRPLSPSPLWFPALQDEYFSSPVDDEESPSYSSSASSRSDARWASSSTSRTAAAAAAAEKSTPSAADVDLSSSLLSSSSSSEETAADDHVGSEDVARVEIVGMPLLLDRHDDGAVKTGGKNNEDDDPKGLILLGWCHSHDTMTTATTTASTTCTAAGVRDAPVDGAAGAWVGGPAIMARARSDNVIQHHQHESSAAQQGRRSRRDSRRALSAQDWDSILGRVKSGDTTIVDRAGDGTARAKEGATA